MRPRCRLPRSASQRMPLLVRARAPLASERPPRTRGWHVAGVAGTVVGAVRATDIDIGDLLTFSVISGAGATFTVDSASGTQTFGYLYVWTSRIHGCPAGNLSTISTLDYNTQASYVMRMRATDNGSPPLFSDATAIVNVTRVPKPPIVMPGTFSVLENATAGTFVGHVRDAVLCYMRAAVREYRNCAGCCVGCKLLEYGGTDICHYDGGDDRISNRRRRRHRVSLLYCIRALSLSNHVSMACSGNLSLVRGGALDFGTVWVRFGAPRVRLRRVWVSCRSRCTSLL